MPTPAELKASIDSQITDKTAPYSISNIDVGERLKDIIDIIGSPVLAANLTVQVGNTPVGGAVTGDVYTQGSTIEAVLRDILIKAVPPTYVPPTSLLTENANNPGGTIAFEAGTSLNLTFILGFTKNDAGNEASRNLLKNNVQISTTTPYTDNAVTIPDTSIVYKGTVTYLQGACKNNNLGTQDCSGRIPAGTITSNLLTYNGYRKAFSGVASAVPTTSAQVRALAGSTPNPINGTQFTINIIAGSNKVVFAYPATLEDVSSVKFVEFANSEVKANFTKTLVNVAGNNSYSPISYKVFVYEPVEPFQTNATYVVTI